MAARETDIWKSLGDTRMLLNVTIGPEYHKDDVDCSRHSVIENDGQGNEKAACQIRCRMYLTCQAVADFLADDHDGVRNGYGKACFSAKCDLWCRNPGQPRSSEEWPWRGLFFCKG